MSPRFVVVPAVPKDLGATRHGGRYYCKTEPIEFNIYDNFERRRQQTSFKSREEAEALCLRLNQDA
jgi:hypothetical protein